MYAYTLSSARTMGMDKQIGSLSKGKQADFLILDRDIFAVSGKEVSETQTSAGVSCLADTSTGGFRGGHCVTGWLGCLKKE